MSDENVSWDSSNPFPAVSQSDSARFAGKTEEFGCTLKGGLRLPALGFGTWQIPNSAQGAQIISCAVETGYRLIDTAAMYGNERAVGTGIRMSGIDRSEVVVTSKVNNDMRGYQRTMDAFFRSLNDLDLDYIDLYLIHWPANAENYDNWDELNLSSWKAMVELYNEGYVRAIGVSNFLPHHLRSLVEKTGQVPMVNQIEFHPGYTQQKVLDYCAHYDIAVEGWGPFGRGAVLDNDVIVRLAQKHGKTPSQICLRYALQRKVIPLPKTVRPERMAENLSVFDFALDGEDLRMLDGLASSNLGYSGEDPDKVL